jgi:hypothetical protein
MDYSNEATGLYTGIAHRSILCCHTAVRCGTVRRAIRGITVLSESDLVGLALPQKLVRDIIIEYYVTFIIS